jgi:hypothetical protein
MCNTTKFISKQCKDRMENFHQNNQVNNTSVLTVRHEEEILQVFISNTTDNYNQVFHEKVIVVLQHANGAGVLMSKQLYILNEESQHYIPESTWC